ncbi:MAG: hypothetical protein HDT18_08655 [Oscillibacter sp.]|nr:hypothetical protein [Oscillibacter sp.]
MTSFYPYQWDLNYRNPRVFNEMMYNFLFLTNKGMDMIRIDAVPYIWKELGTDCRRATDVKDISRRVVNILTGQGDAAMQDERPAILVADDLTPSETVQLDKSKLPGFITRHGSSNSHERFAGGTGRD